MSNKIFIIYHDELIIKELLEYIYQKNNDSKICRKFISDPTIMNIPNDNISEYYFLNQREINIAYKNNSLLYLIHKNYLSTGITIDDFYMNDIFFLSYKEYNLIADTIFKKYNIMTIWVDSSKSNYNQYKIDITALEKRLEFVQYNYFINESIEDISVTIENFLNNIENN